MAELEQTLKEKYPELIVVVGCGPTAKCGITGRRCSQIVSTGCIASSHGQVTSLPEAPNATGCPGCEAYKP